MQLRAWHASAWPLCPTMRCEEEKAQRRAEKTPTNTSFSQQRRASDLDLLRFVMCGARRPRKQNRAASCWFFLFFFSVLLLPIAMSQGDRKLLHVGDGEGSHSPPISSGGRGGGEEEEQRLTSRLGSSPPCCERKCGGCAPCKPVQVRAGAGEGRIRPECANYEPVGWKCKCGAAVFDP